MEENERNAFERVIMLGLLPRMKAHSTASNSYVLICVIGLERNPNMNQSTSTTHHPLLGAAYMVGAGVAFAIINAITFKVTASPDYGGLGFAPQSDTFWQYAFALVISLPFLWRAGLLKFKTKQPIPHLIRVALSAAGLQAFVYAISKGVPVWQVVALTMTAPFFVLIGAKLFLKENVTTNRWIASLLGFAGALIVTNPWSEAFNLYWLLPVVAAILWGAASLLTKYLARDESPETLTTWLLLLLTPINLFWAVGAGFQVPVGNVLWFIIIGGFLVFVAQFFLSKSYAAADANFVQPFDDLKLIANVLVYGIFFGYWPQGYIWIGLAMIMSGSFLLLWQETKKSDAKLGTASA
jgi:drug/metabolite transporter (DMT)-like permease